MPRHPSTKIRRGNGKPRSVNRADRKINKWDKIADIPLDDEAHCKFSESPFCPRHQTDFSLEIQFMHLRTTFFWREMSFVVMRMVTTKRFLA